MQEEQAWCVWEEKTCTQVLRVKRNVVFVSIGEAWGQKVREEWPRSWALKERWALGIVEDIHPDHSKSKSQR